MSPWKIKKLDHVMLNVRDIEKSYRFYHDILGLKEEWTGKSRPAAHTGRMGTEKVCLKDFKEKPQKILLEGLELIQMKDPVPESVKPQESEKFFRHISFWVDDVDAIVEDLKAKGVTFQREVREFQYTDAPLVVRFTFCLDPDGIPVEFLNWRRL
jgi:catechol 2,3-dioxygenase-like lactoylglutathione lyase family enzyme